MDFRALRYQAKAALSGLRLPVRAGPLKGAWISVFSGIHFLRGDYDAEQVAQLLAELQPGDVFYDVGAHIGYYGLAAARRVGPQGRVYAFEPLPLNLKLLRGHVAANGADNVEVIAAGVAEAPGTARFDLGKGTGRGRLGDGGGLEVQLVSLDDLLARGVLRPPTMIKMDVEGAELQALRGARQLLTTHHPQIMLSVHSAQLKEDCSRLLIDSGYRLIPTSKPGQILAKAL